MKTKTLLAGLGLCLLAACSISKEELIVDKELDYCNRQVHRTLDIMRSGRHGIANSEMLVFHVQIEAALHDRGRTRENGSHPGK